MDASLSSNPFLMISEPSNVLDLMVRSSALRSLRGRVFRPLDRPVLRAISVDLVAFDAEIDRRFADSGDDDAAPAAAA